MNDKEVIVNISNRNNIPATFKEGNIVFSSLNDLSKKPSISKFSIKTVRKGEEVYLMNGKKHQVFANEFLIVNKDAEVGLNIDKGQLADGVCLYPPEKLLKEILNYVSFSENELLDSPYKDSHDFTFTEKKYSFNENNTGAFLSQKINHLEYIYRNNIDIDFNAFYTELIEILISDQVKVNRKLNKLSSTKRQTKEEIFRRVSVAKSYLEDNYKEKVNLDLLASDVCMSKYHFIRSFKSIYNISPFQYLLQIRLKKAAELLEKEYSFAEVNDLVGFSDEKNLRKAYLKFI